jgi:hypothetical protein
MKSLDPLLSQFGLLAFGENKMPSCTQMLFNNKNMHNPIQ